VTVYEIVYGLKLNAASTQLKKALAWLNQNELITPVNCRLPCSSLHQGNRKEARRRA
jgi:predicted membrane GTPase involved in stress response